VFVNNYPPVGGQHLNNVVSAAPVFQEGQIVAYVAVRAHWVDVGGIAPTSMSWEAREIFQEGAQYRGLRVLEEGREVPDVFATIAANSRRPEDTIGDLRAQIAGCMIGCRRWAARIAARWTVTELGDLVRQQAARSRAFAGAA